MFELIPNEEMISTFLMFVVAFWVAMERMIKPAIKRINPYIGDKINTTSVFPWVANVLGIVAAFMIFDEMSLAKMFNVYTDNQILEYVDMVLTGMLIGAGEQNAHDFIDWLKGKVSPKQDEPKPDA